MSLFMEIQVGNEVADMVYVEKIKTKPQIMATNFYYKKRKYKLPVVLLQREKCNLKVL